MLCETAETGGRSLFHTGERWIDVEEGGGTQDLEEEGRSETLSRALSIGGKVTPDHLANRMHENLASFETRHCRNENR